MSALQIVDLGNPPSSEVLPRRGIGVRLLALIVLFSSVVTLIATMLQLYLDYRRDVGAIAMRMGEIEHSYLATLGASLWHMDIHQIELQIEGILRLPDTQAVEVRALTAGATGEPLVIAVGQRRPNPAIAREFPLTHSFRGSLRQLGVLYVEATLDNIYRKLFDKALVILVSQGIKTFLVSLFILYIVHRLITRHLAAIARYLGDYNLRTPSPALRLVRTPRPEEDELDRMVAAFNALFGSLQHAYNDLRHVNAALERDVAARRRAEEEVTRLNAILEQRVRQRTAELEVANKELGAFAYSVSHDLRAPLRRIDGFGRLLIEQFGDIIDERGVHYLNRIRTGTREMGEMIDSFLKLSRSTRGEMTIEPVDLSELARDVLDRLAERDPDRRVCVDIQPGLIVDGDGRLLRSALENLLGNAWKYTRRTGDAAIAFGGEENRTGGERTYFVRDNGAGFDMSFADRLFAPFHRLHPTEEFDGSGIGLATVQRIIARHGGRVWAEAEVGRGATFYFTCREGGASHGHPDDPAG